MLKIKLSKKTKRYFYMTMIGWVGANILFGLLILNFVISNVIGWLFYSVVGGFLFLNYVMYIMMSELNRMYKKKIKELTKNS